MISCKLYVVTMLLKQELVVGHIRPLIALIEIDHFIRLLDLAADPVGFDPVTCAHNDDSFGVPKINQWDIFFCIQVSLLRSR